MFPNFKLAVVFAKTAQSYGHIVLHLNNANLLTRDLGDALSRQKQIMQNSQLTLGVIDDAIEIAAVIVEVKLLTALVAKKLEIDTKGKSDIAVFDEIIEKTESGNSNAARKIKDTLEWTRAFYALPEVQEILKQQRIAIEKPESVKDFSGIARSVTQFSSRLMQEASIIQDVLKKAREIPDPKNPPKIDPPKNDEPKI